MDPAASTASATAAAGAAAAAAASTAAAPSMLMSGGGGLNGLGEYVPEPAGVELDGKETDVADEFKEDEEGWPTDEVGRGRGGGGGCSARCDDDVNDA